MKQPTEFQYFKAWLIFFLVATVGGFIVGLIAGFCLGIIVAAAGGNVQQLTNLGRIIGFVVAIPVSYFTFRGVVGKYLLPKLEEDEPTPAPPPPIPT